MTDEQWEQLRPFAEALNRAESAWSQHQQSLMGGVAHIWTGQELRRKVENEIAASGLLRVLNAAREAYAAQRLKVLGF